ncbi:flagellar biosynthesis, FliO family protein [Escherichia coli]|nr:flagellar biosynthesis, FliO family protein [Escherichia coli]
MCIHLNLMIFTKIIRGFISTLQVIYPINMRDKNIVHGIEISNKREYIPAPSLHKRCRK